MYGTGNDILERVEGGVIRIRGERERRVGEEGKTNLNSKEPRKNLWVRVARVARGAREGIEVS